MKSKQQKGIMTEKKDATKIEESHLDILDTSAAETSRATLSVIQVLHLDSVAHVDLLEHQLSNTITLLDHKVLLSKVEQDNANRTLIMKKTTQVQFRIPSSRGQTKGQPCKFIAAVLNVPCSHSPQHQLRYQRSA